ncbi:hypothetical protein QBC46DRAFT_215586, partial [Diplogelasinospora grovesii]
DESVAEHAETDFLLEFGDWAKAIHDAVKHQYKKKLDAEKDQEITKLLALGMSKRRATTTANKTFKTLSFNTRPGEVYDLLSQHLEKVRKQTADGRVETDTPEHRMLVRIREACEDAQVEYQHYLVIMKTYADRVAKAHHPPPDIKDYRKPDNTIDWNGFFAACENFKDSLETAYRSGLLTEERLNLFRKTVDTFFNTYV